MRTEELISIVIPSCGDGIWLKRTVDSIRAMTTWSNYEIITVLNYSSENSRYNDVEFLRQPIYKDIIVIESNHPLGVSGARNIGASIAKGFFICFMDGQCLVLTPDWVRPILEHFHSDSQLCVICPEIKYFHGNGEFLSDEFRWANHYVWGATWDWKAISFTQEEYWIGNKPHFDKTQPYDMLSCPGSITFVRRDTFLGLGLFDVSIAGWGREILDFTIRTWLMGYHVQVNPNVKMAHRIKQDIRDYQYLRDWNYEVYASLLPSYKYFTNANRIGRCRNFYLENLQLKGYVSFADDRARQFQLDEYKERFVRAAKYNDDWLFAKFKID
ncbi:MAG: glycosyltransferase [Anaerolineales bacterium]